MTDTDRTHLPEHALLVVARGEVPGAGGERRSDLLEADQPFVRRDVGVLVFEHADAQERQQRRLLTLRLARVLSARSVMSGPLTAVAYMTR